MAQAEEKARGARRVPRWVKRALIALVVVIAACCVGFLLYAHDAYPAGGEARAAIAAGSEPGADVPVEETSAAIAVGSLPAAYGFVLYPGAKVSPEAYVPLACKLAERGVFCVIVRMPLNFAFFDVDAASRVIAQYPQVGAWWVGGHSLGGAMAAQWASSHVSEVAGVALLGSYAACDLSTADLRAEVIYGSADGVLNRQKLEACQDNLPAGAQTLVIEGGNHAGFGDYGPQSGDGEAAISADDQQTQAADAIASAMAA